MTQCTVWVRKRVLNASVAGTGASFIFGHEKAKQPYSQESPDRSLRELKARMQKSRSFASCPMWIHEVSNPLARKDWLMNPF